MTNDNVLGQVKSSFPEGPKGKPEVNARQTCFFNAEENGYLWAEINKLIDEKNSLDAIANGYLSRLEKKNKQIDELKDENSFLTDKVDSFHRVVDNRDRFIHKIQDENSNLHNTIDALERKCEAWGVGETSETVMMTKANYKKLRDKITDLEKDNINIKAGADS